MNATAQVLIDRLFEEHPYLEPCRGPLEGALRLLVKCFRRGGKLLVCGNGGSAADSEHIVGELMKGFRLRRPLDEKSTARLTRQFPEEGPVLGEKLQGALPAISLVSQVSLTSAVANDTSPDMVFAQQVYGYGRPGDVLLAISTSGRAANVLNAAKVARAFGVSSVALTGAGGASAGEAANPLAALCDVALAAPGADTAAIQENHMRLYHCLCAALEAQLFAK